MNDREQLFRQGRILQALVHAKPIDGLAEFLFEEVQGQVLFGLEIIEQSAFRDPGPFRNRLGRGLVKPFLGEESERGLQDRLAGSVFVAIALATIGRPGSLAAVLLHARNMSALMFVGYFGLVAASTGKMSTLIYLPVESWRGRVMR